MLSCKLGMDYKKVIRTYYDIYEDRQTNLIRAKSYVRTLLDAYTDAHQTLTLFGVEKAEELHRMSDFLEYMLEINDTNIITLINCVSTLHESREDYEMDYHKKWLILFSGFFKKSFKFYFRFLKYYKSLYKKVFLDATAYLYKRVYPSVRP